MTDTGAMDVKAFAARYHLSEWMVRREIARGALDSFRLGEKLLRIPEGAWEQYLERQQEQLRQRQQPERRQFSETTTR